MPEPLFYDLNDPFYSIESYFWFIAVLETSKSMTSGWDFARWSHKTGKRCIWEAPVEETFGIFMSHYKDQRKGLFRFIPIAPVFARHRYRIPPRLGARIPSLYLQKQFSFSVVIFCVRNTQYLYLQRSVCFAIGIVFKKEKKENIKNHAYSESFLAL